MPSQREINAGFAAVRKIADYSGYGNWIGDQMCIDIAVAVLRAAESARQIVDENKK